MHASNSEFCKIAGLVLPISVIVASAIHSSVFGLFCYGLVYAMRLQSKYSPIR